MRVSVTIVALLVVMGACEAWGSQKNLLLYSGTLTEPLVIVEGACRQPAKECAALAGSVPLDMTSVQEYTYALALTAEPNATVTVSLALKQIGEHGGSVSPTTLSFTVDNYSTFQKVVVTSDVIAGFQKVAPVIIQHELSGGDSGYSGLVESAAVYVVDHEPISSKSSSSEVLSRKNSNQLGLPPVIVGVVIFAWSCPVVSCILWAIVKRIVAYGEWQKHDRNAYFAAQERKLQGRRQDAV